jgi:hypothetical protein
VNVKNDTNECEKTLRDKLSDLIDESLKGILKSNCIKKTPLV